MNVHTGTRILPIEPSITLQRPPASQTQALRVVATDSLAELDSHGAAWNVLSINSRERIARHTFPYLKAYFKSCVAPEDRWLCLFVYDVNHLVGVMPLVIHSAASTSRWLHRVDIAALTTLVEEGWERGVISAFLSELEAHVPDYQRIRFACLHESAVPARVGAAAFRPATLFREYAATGSYLPIRGNLKDYYQTLSSNFRRNLRKRRKKLSLLTDVHYEFWSGADITDRDFSRFLDLEASGWKGEMGTAVGCSPRLTRFYRELLANFREAGWAELHFLKTRTRIIAGQMGIRIGGSLNLWKLAYDEQFAHCSPGNLLFEKSIERAYALGDITEINCLTDMDWQKNWKMSQYRYFNLYLFPNRPKAFFLGTAPMMLRQLLRKVPGISAMAKAIRP